MSPNPKPNMPLILPNSSLRPAFEVGDVMVDGLERIGSEFDFTDLRESMDDATVMQAKGLRVRVVVRV